MREREVLCGTSGPLDAVMRILVSDPTWADDLVAYLRRCSCSAEVVGRGVIDASPPRAAVDSSYLRMELDAYLRVWREMHDGVSAQLLEQRHHDSDPCIPPAEALP
jgi:hypothetical protein